MLPPIAAIWTTGRARGWGSLLGLGRRIFRWTCFGVPGSANPTAATMLLAVGLAGSRNLGALLTMRDYELLQILAGLGDVLPEGGGGDLGILRLTSVE
jgi:hypothetical protein